MRAYPELPKGSSVGGGRSTETGAYSAICEDFEHRPTPNHDPLGSSGQVLRPQLWTIAGPNGAGKSTLVAHFLRDRLPVVNPDDIARELSDANPIRAGKLAIQQQNNYLVAGESFAWETTLSGHREVAFIERAKAKGYKVSLVFIGVNTPNVSVARITERVASGGHFVSPEDVARRFERSLNNLSVALAVVDRAYIFDNTDSRRRLLLSIEFGKIKRAAKVLPAWLPRITQD